MKEVLFRLDEMKFIRRFQLRRIMRERRTGFTVVCGMMIFLLVLMLGLNCYVLCGNVQKDTMNSTRFEYMYFLKYPIKEVNIPKWEYMDRGGGCRIEEDHAGESVEK